MMKTKKKKHYMYIFVIVCVCVNKRVGKKRNNNKRTKETREGLLLIYFMIMKWSGGLIK
jgi:hypothetical protein